jgi:hypothetical protein
MSGVIPLLVVVFVYLLSLLAEHRASFQRFLGLQVYIL